MYYLCFYCVRPVSTFSTKIRYVLTVLDLESLIDRGKSVEKLHLLDFQSRIISWATRPRAWTAPLTSPSPLFLPCNDWLYNVEDETQIRLACGLISLNANLVLNQQAEVKCQQAEKKYYSNKPKIKQDCSYQGEAMKVPTAFYRLCCSNNINNNKKLYEKHFF